mmetsp:Transcript_14240/g.39521  ORF Transcript_14240/g.39521 Transcript_14240/m.39521 type:complete len:536 (+) Transcript_14240:229-1836(+)|eukprot:CAMPEP_0168726208 /NCGR_PEP_ID=MMETSP0724-20121128/4551_1 /TAXON_ID=265536 /ORGANISM="Amphiprora sp., Strain CCMP467" /LENGTH=535 /DNA_ID=CAMNT_0008773017 /DNA_START=142 /DNA_END=1749 /DNA_ORIENTATION=-
MTMTDVVEGKQKAKSWGKRLACVRSPLTKSRKHPAPTKLVSQEKAELEKLKQENQQLIQQNTELESTVAELKAKLEALEEEKAKATLEAEEKQSSSSDSRSNDGGYNSLLKAYLPDTDDKEPSTEVASAVPSDAISVMPSEVATQVDEVFGQRSGLAQANVKVFSQLLQKIADKRKPSEDKIEHSEEVADETENDSTVHVEEGIPLDELKETIEFPPIEDLLQEGSHRKDVPREAIRQLRRFITTLESMFPDNPYHNFRHSSAVSLKAMDFFHHLKSDVDKSRDVVDAGAVLANDPIAQFACVLASLVQDVSHPGVPNFIFGKENPDLALEYKGRCLVQQEAVRAVWRLLMEPTYCDLRAAIYHSEMEKQHFRSVFVRCVLASDLSDKELASSLARRWEEYYAVDDEEEPAGMSHESRATLLLESIAQASYMIHALQDWDVYRKWSGLLFVEVYQAHVIGRIRNPAESWNKGELYLFDNIVLVLSEKLATCDLFIPGSTEEYHKTGRSNRAKWKLMGQAFVEELLDRIVPFYDDP